MKKIIENSFMMSLFPHYLCATVRCQSLQKFSSNSGADFRLRKAKEFGEKSLSEIAHSREQEILFYGITFISILQILIVFTFAKIILMVF